MVPWTFLGEDPILKRIESEMNLVSSTYFRILISGTCARKWQIDFWVDSMFLLIRIKLHSGSDLAIPKTVSRPIPDDVPVIRTVRVILKELLLKQIFYIALVNYMLLIGIIGCSLYR